jgi:hypothetical protein
MSLMTIPWLLALAAGVWFGFMAWRAGRNALLWGLGGALFALVSSTILFGLGQASAIPFSDAELGTLHIKWTLAAVLMIFVLGWLFTMPLHRIHVMLWKAANKTAPGTPLTTATPRTEPRAEAPKPGSKKA